MSSPWIILAPLVYFGGLAALGLIGAGMTIAARGASEKLAPARPAPKGVSNPPSKFAARARMKRLLRPTLLLVPAKHPGFSKIGGQPELPAGVAWPKCDTGPATFVAQLDVGAFHKHGGFDWLPADGILYFFFDETMVGFARCGTVLYTLEKPGSPVAPPADLPKNRRFLERRVAFMRFSSFPSRDWLDDDWSDAVDWASWPLAKDADLGDEIEHRIGGYPSEIQSSRMAVECECLWRGLTYDWRQPPAEDVRRAARQWRLLLQIDSDPALKMNWWDAGRLYVFIRARDAGRGDFSKTVTLVQTY